MDLEGNSRTQPRTTSVFDYRSSNIAAKFILNALELDEKTPKPSPNDARNLECNNATAQP